MCKTTSNCPICNMFTVYGSFVESVLGEVIRYHVIGKTGYFEYVVGDDILKLKCKFYGQSVSTK